MDKFRVLVADDHAVMRAGLRMLIDAQPDMGVVGEAGDGQEAIEHAKASRPDLLLLDLSMPGLGGIAAIELLRKEAPQTKVLILTMHEDPEYLRQALGAGASGYLVKSAAGTELLAAIRAVRRGEVYIYSSLTSTLLDMAFDKRQKQEERDGVANLSKREIEVLRLLALGHTNRQIADKLFLSVKTIDTYRARITEKLQLPTRAELVRYAIKHGLLTPDE
ncbi:MAG TPA: response regulator transcription factor [Candidatus Methylomirabilis sp.]|nr:response regulator transcription factor [Candidatus Methylomirabilis sp.]